VSVVASHEALEMLVDPYVDHPVTQPRDGTSDVYLVEICDPVQGCDYDVGDPEGRKTGIMVADFCLPSWWAMQPSSAPYSFRNSVPGPWEIAPQGYTSKAPQSDPGNWGPVYGAAIQQLPQWASRLPRIHPQRPGRRRPTR